MKSKRKIALGGIYPENLKEHLVEIVESANKFHLGRGSFNNPKPIITYITRCFGRYSNGREVRDSDYIDNAVDVRLVAKVYANGPSDVIDVTVKCPYAKLEKKSWEIDGRDHYLLCNMKKDPREEKIRTLCFYSKKVSVK